MASPSEVSPPVTLFVYGSLMSPRVLEVLLTPSTYSLGGPATLKGFRRTRIAGESYPAIHQLSPGEGSSDDGADTNHEIEVQGRLLILYTSRSLSAIDAFESLVSEIPVRASPSSAPLSPPA